jgi:HAD superfamily phosphoserine phosphatase-like hydrolase
LRTAGIDVRNPYRLSAGTLCLLGETGTARFLEKFALMELPSLLEEFEPEAVGIGAPITPGASGGRLVTRKAETQLRLLQHSCCGNPRFAPLPLPLVRTLARRGTEVAEALGDRYLLIETHPAAVQEFLELQWGEGGSGLLFGDNAVRSQLVENTALVADSPRRLGALLCALTARLHLRSETLVFGDEREGAIILPRPRRIDLAALDVDGTLTEVQSPWRHVHEHLGLWEGVGEGIMRRWLDGEISYDRFCTLDVGLWNQAGATEQQVEDVLDAIPIRDEGLEALSRIVACGVNTVMISTGFRRVAERIAREAGVEGRVEIVANELSREPGGAIRVAVRVSNDAGSRRSKGAILRRIQGRLRISPVRTLAAGDGPSDRQMFERAAQSVLVSGPDDFYHVAELIASGRRAGR